MLLVVCGDSRYAAHSTACTLNWNFEIEAHSSVARTEINIELLHSMRHYLLLSLSLLPHLTITVYVHVYPWVSLMNDEERESVLFYSLFYFE